MDELEGLVAWAKGRIAVLCERAGMEAEVERVDLQGALMVAKRSPVRGAASCDLRIREWKDKHAATWDDRRSKSGLMALYRQLGR